MTQELSIISISAVHIGDGKVMIYQLLENGSIFKRLDTANEFAQQTIGDSHLKSELYRVWAEDV